MHLIKNASVYAPEEIGVKDVLIGGGKILKIGDSFLLAKGKIESSKFFFKINLSIKSLPKNDK